MLEKPDLADERVVACLEGAYGMHVVQLAFLPLGADLNTAVYRAVVDDGTPYFLKLRRGMFDETSVVLPKFLSDQGLAQIIPLVAARTGQLWTTLDPFTVILYPFVEVPSEWLSIRRKRVRLAEDSLAPNAWGRKRSPSDCADGQGAGFRPVATWGS